MERQGHVDRRIIKSRAAIVKSFEHLLETTPLDKITVSAIAREANVDRKTFYVHFGNVEGLLDAMARERVDQLLDAIEGSVGVVASQHDFELGLARFFQILNDAVRTDLVESCARLHSLPADELLSRVRGPLQQGLSARSIFFRDIPPARMECLLAYFLSAILGIYRHWLQSDRSVPIEEISATALDLTLRGIAAIGLGE